MYKLLTDFYLLLSCNRHRGISWRTARGVQTPNYYGSLTQSSTVNMGTDDKGQDVYVPLCKVLPMV
jgi:myo-inositol-1-phosphate synthase